MKVNNLFRVNSSLVSSLCHLSFPRPKKPWVSFCKISQVFLISCSRRRTTLKGNWMKLDNILMNLKFKDDLKSMVSQSIFRYSKILVFLIVLMAGIFYILVWDNAPIVVNDSSYLFGECFDFINTPLLRF